MKDTIWTNLIKLRNTIRRANMLCPNSLNLKRSRILYFFFLTNFILTLTLKYFDSVVKKIIVLKIFSLNTKFDYILLIRKRKFWFFFWTFRSIHLKLGVKNLLLNYKRCLLYYKYKRIDHKKCCVDLN